MEKDLRAVKLVEGSADLETCLAAMHGLQGQQCTAPSPAAPASTCPASTCPASTCPASTCPATRVKWNRRFTCAPLSTAELLRKSAYHQPTVAPPSRPPLQMPRQPAPQSDPIPFEWNLADSATISSPERALNWGWAARQRLRQPPCESPTVEDVTFFLKSFLETRPGPDGQSLQSRLGEPATLLHFATRVAAQTDGISCFLS